MGFLHSSMHEIQQFIGFERVPQLRAIRRQTSQKSPARPGRTHFAANQ
jgi:hypothetical protein